MHNDLQLRIGAVARVPVFRVNASTRKTQREEQYISAHCELEHFLWFFSVIMLSIACVLVYYVTLKRSSNYYIRGTFLTYNSQYLSTLGLNIKWSHTTEETAGVKPVFDGNVSNNWSTVFWYHLYYPFYNIDVVPKFCLLCRNERTMFYDTIRKKRTLVNCIPDNKIRKCGKYCNRANQEKQSREKTYRCI